MRPGMNVQSSEGLLTSLSTLLQRRAARPAMAAPESPAVQGRTVGMLPLGYDPNAPRGTYLDILV